jgi:hypothetical protein
MNLFDFAFALSNKQDAKWVLDNEMGPAHLGSRNGFVRKPCGNPCMPVLDREWWRLLWARATHGTLGASFKAKDP